MNIHDCFYYVELHASCPISEETFTPKRAETPLIAEDRQL